MSATREGLIAVLADHDGQGPVVQADAILAAGIFRDEREVILELLDAVEQMLAGRVGTGSESRHLIRAYAAKIRASSTVDGEQP